MNKRLKAIEWWNELTPLQKSEYAQSYYISLDKRDKIGELLGGWDIEQVWKQQNPQNAEDFTNFNDFLEEHPYQLNVIYTKEQWELHLFENWFRENGFGRMDSSEPREIIEELGVDQSDAFTTLLKEKEDILTALQELWEFTECQHPFSTNNCQEESVFGKVKSILSKYKLEI